MKLTPYRNADGVVIRVGEGDEGRSAAPQNSASGRRLPAREAP